ncbi:hypothetical protein IF2G_00085 [Cordyceps javanica]|nr:hypothetical protein IF2G_00085 [Cordyceps javanica]
MRSFSRGGTGGEEAKLTWSIKQGTMKAEKRWWRKKRRTFCVFGQYPFAGAGAGNACPKASRCGEA